MSKIVALITACGRGLRLGVKDGIPKQYLPIAGIPILRHSILQFLNHPAIDEVMCIIHPDDLTLYEEAVIGLDLLNPVFGGPSRQESIRIGLEALKIKNPHKVLIHDGVRPFISKAIISGIVEKLKTHPAVIPAILVEDTIKKCENGTIEWTVERENMWRAQTPQGFDYQDILESHRAFKDLTFTDDSALNEYAGIPVAIIPGSQNNFKITTIEDYHRAEQMAQMFIKQSLGYQRSGIGFDVHSFCEPKEGEEGIIYLGGVAVKHSKRVVAHSDGDVLIHAIIDAMLGAASLGDIGDLFPPSDEKWRNISSVILLEKVDNLLRKNGNIIVNIDATVICEEPKLFYCKAIIKESLAKILKIEEQQVSVKATTTEKLGFLGRGEGIAAQAIVNIVKSNNCIRGFEIA
jgi:2-C-methyl-D-erythritol 4-phosphate cytidylyltransferase/2-C-methyl-D-erythritol 2,4-cyclodiphosphate synthase